MKANTNKGKYDLGIITDTHAAPANVQDSIVYLGRLDRQVERFGFAVGAVGLDPALPWDWKIAMATAKVPQPSPG